MTGFFFTQGLSFQLKNNKAAVTMPVTLTQTGARIGTGPIRDETINYAYQIENMITKADFKIPDGDTNKPFGIHVDETAMMFVKMGDEADEPKKWPDVEFITDTTNDISTYTFQVLRTDNGISLPIISKEDTNGIYAALFYVFNQIGIAPTWACKPDWTGTNHIEIFVLQKPQ
jgi:hypothetical protein